MGLYYGMWMLHATSLLPNLSVWKYRRLFLFQINVMYILYLSLKVYIFFNFMYIYISYKVIRYLYVYYIYSTYETFALFLSCLLSSCYLLFVLHFQYNGVWPVLAWFWIRRISGILMKHCHITPRKVQIGRIIGRCILNIEDSRRLFKPIMFQWWVGLLLSLLYLWWSFLWAQGQHIYIVSVIRRRAEEE